MLANYWWSHGHALICEPVHAKKKGEWRYGFIPYAMSQRTKSNKIPCAQAASYDILKGTSGSNHSKKLASTRNKNRLHNGGLLVFSEFIHIQ
jgi:hypothetical protein